MAEWDWTDLPDTADLADGTDAADLSGDGNAADLADAAETADLPPGGEWDAPEPLDESAESDLWAAETADLADGTDAADLADSAETSDLPDDTDMADLPDGGPADRTEGEKAADYLRSLGNQDKLADYVERHFDDSRGPFTPDAPIPITTRNQALEGSVHPLGVPFERREVDMNGAAISGVFPVFDASFCAELGDEVKQMSLAEQFAAARDALQDRMYDDPKTLEGLTLADMDRLAEPGGWAPRGRTWNHGARPGSLELVDSEIHRRVGHTGSNAFCTPDSPSDR